MRTLYNTPNIDSRTYLSQTWALIFFMVFNAAIAYQTCSANEKEQSKLGAQESVGVLNNRFDPRVPIIDPRIARLYIPKGVIASYCSASIASNGALISAGHCNVNQNTTVDFNVPLSSSSGSPKNPDQKFKYSVAKIKQQYEQCEYDWAVFSVKPNSTNQLPAENQKGYFYISNIPLEENALISVSGYGSQSTPPCANGAGCQNIYNLFLKQSSGVVSSTKNSSVYFYAYATKATSGGPIISDSIVYGVLSRYTNQKKCAATFSAGETGEPRFADALHTFPVWAYDKKNIDSDAIIYVNQVSMSQNQTGNYFDPYLNILSGINAANQNNLGNSLLVVEQGNYNAKFGSSLSLENDITIAMLVGDVRIKLK